MVEIERWNRGTYNRFNGFGLDVEPGVGGVGLIFWREKRWYTAAARMSDVMALECISVNWLLSTNCFNCFNCIILDLWALK